MDNVIMRAFFCGIISLTMIYVVYERNRRENMPEDRAQRYLPWISGLLLPTFLVILAGAAALQFPPAEAVRFILSVSFGIFLQICLYYLLLMPLLPFLRRHISARTCAMLWMLPNYLYYMQQSFMGLDRPRFILRVPAGLLEILVMVWLLGAGAVLVYFLVSHFLFRHKILRDARDITDPLILSVWEEELKNAYQKPPELALVESPAVSTPLTVGLFRVFSRVVLPQRTYTREQLSLLLRHELVHIGRQDAANKFFLVFCTALCWFNPLMWIARRKSSDDLELSCDETVLLNCDEAERRRYADLLLTTAGEERGFTTCLSASADALRYRLKNVLKPSKKRSGAVLLGTVFFVLFMTSGYTTLAYSGATGSDVLFDSEPPAGTLTFIVPSKNQLYCADETAFLEFLAEIPMDRIVGIYDFNSDGRSLSFFLDDADGVRSYVSIQDDIVEISSPFTAPRETYYLPGGMDWAAVDRLIEFYPTLDVSLTDSENHTQDSITASLYRVESLPGGEVVKAMDPLETPSGIFTSRNFSEMTLTFSQSPIGNVTVEIAPRGNEEKEVLTLTESDLSSPIVLPREKADYFVRTEFTGNTGGRYLATYRFVLGEP